MNRILFFAVAFHFSIFGLAARAQETFTGIATSCALKYDVQVGRNQKTALDEVSGQASLDISAFLLLFPKEERSKVALAWLECLAPMFPNDGNGGIIPAGEITGNNTDFPDLTNKTLTVDVFLDVNGKTRHHFPFSVSSPCRVQLKWDGDSGVGFVWAFSLRTEFDSNIVSSNIGTNNSPEWSEIGRGNYVLVVVATRGAVRAKMQAVTMC